MEVSSITANYLGGYNYPPFSFFSKSAKKTPKKTPQKTPKGKNIL